MKTSVWALRMYGVPKEHIEWFKMDHKAESHVHCSTGFTKKFQIKVGVHQSSVHSPLLLIIVMDAITRSVKKPALWTLHIAATYS